MDISVYNNEASSLNDTTHNVSARNESPINNSSLIENMRFSRTELVIGRENILKLQKANVAIFGAGGVGGCVIEGLARGGIGNISIIDNDIVDITNINRQIIALTSTIGQKKVEVAKQRVLDINPNCNVTTYDTFYTPETANLFNFSNYDYVIDAIDTITGKISLVIETNKTKTPIISAMGAGNKMDPTKFEVSDIFKTSVCPLARVMRRELKNRGIKKLKVVYSKEQPAIITKDFPGSISFVPTVVGFIIAGEVIKDILH